MTVYPLLKTAKGLQPSEFEVAAISYAEKEFRIDCPDGALREKITEIFSRPLTVMKSSGAIPQLFSHSFVEVLPGEAGFFDEIIFELRKYNLFGVIKKK